MKNGYIDISNLNVPPERAELNTAKYFAALGKNIVFIKPSSIPNQHMPDILMDGIECEIKCPIGNSKRTIENNLRAALQQSSFVIFDLRNLKYPETKAITKLQKEFAINSKLQKLLIIKRDGELLTYT